MNKKEARYIRAIDRRFQEHSKYIVGVKNKIIDKRENGHAVLNINAYNTLKHIFGIRDTDFQFDERLMRFAYRYLHLDKRAVHDLIQQAYQDYRRQYTNHLHITNTAHYDAMRFYRDLEERVLNQ